MSCHVISCNVMQCKGNVMYVCIYCIPIGIYLSYYIHLGIHLQTFICYILIHFLDQIHAIQEILARSPVSPPKWLAELSVPMVRDIADRDLVPSPPTTVCSGGSSAHELQLFSNGWIYSRQWIPVLAFDSVGFIWMQLFAPHFTVENGCSDSDPKNHIAHIAKWLYPVLELQRALTRIQMGPAATKCGFVYYILLLIQPSNKLPGRIVYGNILKPGTQGLTPKKVLVSGIYESTSPTAGSIVLIKNPGFLH